MKAAVIHGPGDIRIENIPYPKAEPGDVIVRIGACGICGSDLPRAFDGKAHFYPTVVGHEAAGEVVEIGAAVTRFSPGDRVAVAPLVPCMGCEACQLGRYSLCGQYSFVGSRRQGCMAEYVAVPERSLVPIPKDLSYEQAAMLEPATVPLYGLLKVGSLAGLRVVVLGVGTIGLLAMMWTKFLGASQVIAVDINDWKLDRARELGADEVINSKGLGNGDGGLVEAVRSVTSGAGCDLAVETAGHPITQVQAVEICANGGRVLYVGTAHEPVHFAPKAFEAIVRKELVIYGSWMSYSAPFPGREWQIAAKALSNGALDPSAMITHRFELAEAREAFETLRSSDRAIKVMLFMDDNY
ncbi:MAG: galactitol-1-phosphate 5-dehydrogenase [Firmicutes bacterium]|nr:galactitol-1-phosphate 5-dehydrogenase [Bacillota bacterium]